MYWFSGTLDFRKFLKYSFTFYAAFEVLKQPCENAYNRQLPKDIYFLAHSVATSRLPISSLLLSSWYFSDQPESIFHSPLFAFLVSYWLNQLLFPVSSGGKSSSVVASQCLHFHSIRKNPPVLTCLNISPTPYYYILHPYN
jgi:hypothetical protein